MSRRKIKNLNVRAGRQGRTIGMTNKERLAWGEEQARLRAKKKKKEKENEKSQSN